MLLFFFKQFYFYLFLTFYFLFSSSPYPRVIYMLFLIKFNHVAARYNKV